MSIRTIAVVSGGFDPLHSGHIEMIKAARRRADVVYVGLNSDAWLERKKGKAFMPWEERAKILNCLRDVDGVLSFNDSDGSACALLRDMLDNFPEDEIMFCNGGDRTANNIPEMSVQDSRLTFAFGIGGDTKQAASSDFLKAWREPVWTERPWGRWAVFDQGPRFKVKRLEILPDRAISLQYHNKRGEYWTVVQGSALASINGKVTTYNVGDGFHVPVGKLHRIYNNGLGMLVCVEVQYGECYEEDIVRV
jgi:cytidyltransferase-like protein